MKKRIFIVHCWDGGPENFWYPWLKEELEKLGFQVFIPFMPNSAKPSISEWVGHIDKIVGRADEQTYFVGHSIGCQTIIRYAESLDDQKIGGAVFVAGWFDLLGLKSDEERNIARPWIENPINYKKIKHVIKHIVGIFSDDDPYVSLENADLFKDRLNAEIIMDNGRGHFDTDEMKQLPSVLEAIKRISK